MSNMRKRERSKFFVENPSIDDCLWCSKKVISPVRCISCNQAYHKACAAQCGYLPSGAIKKCCDESLRLDASFSAQVVQSNLIDESEDGSALIESDVEVAASSGEKPITIAVLNAVIEEAAANITANITKSINLTITKSTAGINDTLLSLQTTINEIAVTTNKNKEDIEALKSSCSSMDTLLQEHSSSISALSASTSDCSDSIKELQQNISELKSNSNNAVTESVKKVVADFSVSLQEKMFSEFIDRQRRSNNLIFYNLPDNASRDQSLSDKNMALDILKKTKEFSDDSVNVVRLGVYKQGKSRPLLVKLQCREDVFTILRNKSTLYKNYAFSTDKTSAQREYFKQLLKEVEELNQRNPNDLKMVKFLNDTPQIVNKKASKNL